MEAESWAVSVSQLVATGKYTAAVYVRVALGAQVVVLMARHTGGAWEGKPSVKIYFDSLQTAAAC